MIRVYSLVALIVLGLFAAGKASTYMLVQGHNDFAGSALVVAASPSSTQNLQGRTGKIGRASDKVCPKDHTPCGPADDQFCCNNATTDCVNGACQVKSGVFGTSPGQTAPSTGR